VHVIREGRQNKRLPAGDFPCLGVPFPTFSPRAKDALDRLLSGSGEWLPLLSDSEYWMFYVTDVRDALDVGDSDCTFFRDGTLMDVGRCSFIESGVKDAVIFRLKQAPMLDVFVTSAFVDCVNGAGLRGFRFVPTWEE
jgi:hypothetical protein